MTRRTEIIIAVSVLVLLIVVLLAIMLRQKPNLQPATGNQGSSEQTTTTTTTPATETPVVPPAPLANPQTTTMIFVERFSSYSSESDFANVTDVMPLVTASLGARLQQIAQQERAKGTDQAYYGISTKVISEKVVAQTDVTAEYLVSTQRAESIGSPGNTTVRYQDITVKLVKEGDAWKVSDFSWAN
jgi:hypothetical protein